MPKKTAVKMTKTKNNVFKTLNKIQPHQLTQMSSMIKMLSAVQNAKKR